MIRLEHVQKEYADGTVAVNDLSLSVAEGDVCVLVGPSGCGKTTTMRLINRLADTTRGEVYVDDKDVTHADPVQLRRSIGYVIQQVGLFPHQSVRKNVGTVCRLLGWDKAEIDKRADEMLHLVGLDPDVYGDRYPHQLSGGQSQRVGVARALASRPPVLLMDEPFGAVDPIARDRLQEEFLNVQRELGITTVIVTHDIDEAVRLGDRIAVMSEGGNLEQYDTPATILGRPANDFVAEFVGSDRLLKLMSVTDIDDAMVPDAAPHDADLPEVRIETSLRDVSLALLASPQGRVAVVDGSGALVGTLTLDDVRKILASEREAGPPGRPEVDPVSGQTAGADAQGGAGA
ncbi:MAG: ABC transporter ATP-binding protein [Actinobacteria bacterium]|nr:ABC transporter ATP-binding protein [Actinomycetota bacterium]